VHTAAAPILFQLAGGGTGCGYCGDRGRGGTGGRMSGLDDTPRVVSPCWLSVQLANNTIHNLKTVMLFPGVTCVITRRRGCAVDSPPNAPLPVWNFILVPNPDALPPTPLGAGAPPSEPSHGNALCALRHCMEGFPFTSLSSSVARTQLGTVPVRRSLSRLISGTLGGG